MKSQRMGHIDTELQAPVTGEEPGINQQEQALKAQYNDNWKAGSARSLNAASSAYPNSIGLARSPEFADFNSTTSQTRCSRESDGTRNNEMAWEYNTGRSHKGQVHSTEGGESQPIAPYQETSSNLQSRQKSTPQTSDLQLSVDGTGDEMTVGQAFPAIRVNGTTLPRGPAAHRHSQLQRDLPRLSNRPLSRWRPGNMNTRSTLQVRGRPLVRGEDSWQTWVEVGVKVYGLPENITTLDVYRLFSKEGSIETIEVFDNPRGGREGSARIRFRPPPVKPFWKTEMYILTREGSDHEILLRLELDMKRRSFLAPSPINPNIKYPEWTVINAQSLDFGFMIDASSMMTMHKVEAVEDTVISFGLNLLRREIDVQFQLSMTDPRHNETSAQDYPDLGQLDRKDKFRFRLPLAQLDKFYELEVGSEKRILFISLENPPNFYRKTRNTESTHEQRASYWGEFDTWYRQTDIVYDPRQLKSCALTLKKSKPIIDIGRWTTYRFVFDCSANDEAKYNILCRALSDHNVDKVTFTGYNIINDQEPAVWEWIDKPVNKLSASNSLLAEMEESSVPPLSFPVRYQLEVCISQGCLNEHNLSREFVESLAALEKTNAKDILEYVAEPKRRFYNPMDIFGTKITRGSASRRIPSYCAYTRSATVTPSTIYYSTPTVETSNRIIRRYAHYADRFLRVRFTDEKFQGRINATDKDSSNEIFTRIKRAMTNGITIGDRHFEFLAFGNSQFREHGAYFFAPLPHERAEDIRAWMGNFDSIKIVAKHAARLGQCFSTTRAIHGTRVEIREILDVERNGFNFSDGVGMISSFLAKMIASELGLLHGSENPPSLYQFRLGGCKGVLAISPQARMREMFIRPSQYKFPAAHNGLEIIRWSQFAAATLNRQIIIVLSALGVPDMVFVGKLRNMLSNLAQAMTDEKMAIRLLQRHIDPNQMTINLASLVLEGFMRTQEPFVTSLLQLWRAWSIKYLKSHAKIVIEQGAFLLGCVDETATLKGHLNDHQPSSNKDTEQQRLDRLPEIFVQISDPENKGHYVVIEGVCLLARNPSLHPGDIRVVRAVDTPALHHLRDVVVLPQTGDRDIASMCSGGDLDGDDYLVLWDKDLLPTEWNHQPMDYTPPKPRKLDREVTVDDITSFFVTYMKNDRLPQIAHAHLATADLAEDGVKDERCLQLASLHSMAVDYVKSGQPAVMPKELRVRRFPHFMEKFYLPKEQTYVSGKVLGQLYDQVERVDFVPLFDNPFDKRILQAYSLDDEILIAASQIKEEYDAAIRRIMAQHEIRTEFEVWSTFVLSHAGQSKDYKFHEEIGQISGALKDRFCDICREKAGGKEFDKLGPFVAAMYAVTEEEMAYAVSECRQKKMVGGREVPLRKMEVKSMPLMSFPWLFPSILGKIANGGSRAGEDSAANAMSAAESQVRKLRRVAATRTSIAEDLIETVEGVTHRGEILELFHHGEDAETDEGLGSPEPRSNTDLEGVGSWDSPIGDESLSKYQPMQSWTSQEQMIEPKVGDSNLLLDDEEYHAEDEEDQASGTENRVDKARQEHTSSDLLMDSDIEEPLPYVSMTPIQHTEPHSSDNKHPFTATTNISTDSNVRHLERKRMMDSESSENDAVRFTPQRSDEEEIMPIAHEEQEPLDADISTLSLGDANGSDDDYEEEQIVLDVKSGKSALEALADLTRD